MAIVALLATIPRLDIACQATAIAPNGRYQHRRVQAVRLIRTKTEIIARRAMAAADGLLRSVSKQAHDAQARTIRTQPAADQQKEILRLRRFSQCSRRVCFALCDDYCERVFAPWQNCGAHELAQESGRCGSESPHS